MPMLSFEISVEEKPLTFQNMDPFSRTSVHEMSGNDKGLYCDRLYLQQFNLMAIFILRKIYV